MPGFSTETLTQDVQSAISDLLRAIKSYWFYTENHPAAKDVVKHLTDKIASLLDDGPIYLNFTRDELFLGALPISNKNSNIADFCSYINKRRVYNMTFKPGIAEEEMLELIRILTMSPKKIRQSGGIKKMLNEANSSHIDVTEYLYDTTQTSSMDEDAEPPNPILQSLTDESLKLFQSFLTGELPEIPEEQSEIFLAIMEDPQRMVELMIQALAKEKVSKGDSHIIGLVQQFYCRISGWLKHKGPEEKDIFLRRLGSSFCQWKGAVGLQSLRNTDSLSPDNIRLLQDILDKMTDDELVELLIKNLPENSSDLNAADLLSDLAILDNRKKQLMPQFMALLEKRREEEKEDKKLFELQQTFRDLRQPQVLEKTSMIFLELWEAEQDGPVRKDLIGIFHRTLPDLLKSENIHLCREILETLFRTETISIPGETGGSLNIRETLFTKELVDSCLSVYENTPNPDRKSFMDVLSYAGIGMVPNYLTVLNNPLHRNLHSFLLDFLEKMGDPVAPLLMETILTCPQPLAVELITLMAHMQTDNSFHHLQKIYPKLSLSMKLSMVKELNKYPCEKNRNWLIEQLKASAELDLKLLLLDGLAAMNDNESIDILRQIALGRKKRKSEEEALQYRAIQWLGRLSRSEVIPELSGMLLSKIWFSSRKKDQLRVAVAQSLSKMNHPDAKVALEQGCKDRRKMVRSACQNLLHSWENK